MITALVLLVIYLVIGIGFLILCKEPLQSDTFTPRERITGIVAIPILWPIVLYCALMHL